MKDRVLQEFKQIIGIDNNEENDLLKLNNLKTVLNDSKNAILIENYCSNSRTEGQKGLKIRHIYSICRKDQEKCFVDCGYDKQRRLLLWHGTKCHNLKGILMNGFKLSHKEDLKFGNGIYFADRVTKSLKYCDQKGTGFLLACEVSVGNMFKTPHPEAYTSAPDQYDSVKGIGKYIPEPNAGVIFNDGIEVPIGKTVESVESKTLLSQLDFNEYIVFDTKRIINKFIVHFEWDLKTII